MLSGPHLACIQFTPLSTIWVQYHAGQATTPQKPRQCVQYLKSTQPASKNNHTCLNPLVPARVKFARFRSVQKWTLLVFRPKSDSVPSKIFLSENILHRQNSISFPLMPFKKSQNLPFGRDGQKSQGRFDQKLLFFLFFRKKDIKTLFEFCNRETFNF